MLTRNPLYPSYRYFVILDEAPIKGSPRPTYELLFGNPDDTTGFSEKRGRTIKELLSVVPPDEDVYRVYLQRTEGKTGKKLIRAGVKA